MSFRMWYDLFIFLKRHAWIFFQTFAKHQLFSNPQITARLLFSLQHLTTFYCLAARIVLCMRLLERFRIEIRSSRSKLVPWVLKSLQSWLTRCFFLFSTSSGSVGIESLSKNFLSGLIKATARRSTFENNKWKKR